MIKSTWRVLHTLIMDRTSTIMMVNQVTTGEKVSNKFSEYYFLLLWTLRRALCVKNLLDLMSLLHFNSHTYGSTCSPFGTCSLGISSQ